MAYVVTEPCFGCKYTDCVVVCPLIVFEKASRCYSYADECIDCGCMRAGVPGQRDLLRGRRAGRMARVVPSNCEMAAVCPPILNRKEPLAGSGGQL